MKEKSKKIDRSQVFITSGATLMSPYEINKKRMYLHFKKEDDKVITVSTPYIPVLSEFRLSELDDAFEELVAECELQKS
jgi:hypothetical protein